jgi:hypothetical protein
MEVILIMGVNLFSFNYFIDENKIQDFLICYLFYYDQCGSLHCNYFNFLKMLNKPTYE